MNVINEAYFNEKDKKLWKIGEQKPRINSIDEVIQLIPNMFIARNGTSKEITGVVVAKIDGNMVEIGPLAVRTKFQVVLT